MTEAFRRELDHFEETLGVIRNERKKAEQALGIEDGGDRFLQALDDGSGDAIVQQFTLLVKLTNLRQLRLSEQSPYFARLDFTPGGREVLPMLSTLRPGERRVIYLGRWGVIQTPEYRLRVADWRSPVANLYYSGQIGKVSYEAPDGVVHGELSLKRMFTVQEGKLVSMQDTGLLDQEKYLADALSQVTTARLREIVTTIQAEQNKVIRHDPFSPVLIQGAAGSGKTTIALHRIAWILYRQQKTIAPRQLLILAPNPLFLSYISRVLPDLGVDDVRQMTFAQLCRLLLGKRMPALTEQTRLEARLSMPPSHREALDGILRHKGSLALAGELDVFLNELEASAYPKDDICFGGHTLVNAAEMKDLFVTQLRHFPFRVRAVEARKVVTARLSKLAGGAMEAIKKAAGERLETLLRAMPDSAARRAKATALLRIRDERLGKLKESQQVFMKAYDSLWPSLGLLDVYGAFWQALAEKDAAYTPAWEATRPLLAKGRMGHEDLPALLWLARRLYGLTSLDIRHVVIDEAQDAPPLEVKVLRGIFGHDAFSLAGDLYQGIHGGEGLRDWGELSVDVFDATPQTAFLSTSYRSTVEIMNYAQLPIQRHPLEGISPGRPVLRHGENPEWIAVTDEDGRKKLILDTILAWRKAGFFSIAVIVKAEETAQWLYKRLQPDLPMLRLVTGGEDAFEGGVMVLGASMVKGLEFDCVLIADAEDSIYPDEPFHAKLLYVLCTRPLHRLRLLGSGKMPDLLLSRTE